MQDSLVRHEVDGTVVVDLGLEEVRCQRVAASAAEATLEHVCDAWRRTDG